jgi:hypothetical protein
MKKTVTIGRQQHFKTLALTCLMLCFYLGSTAQVIVGTGTSTQRFPLSYWYGYGRFAAIYTSVELNTTASGGTITTLAWNSSIASSITGPTVIYLKAVGTTTAVASNVWDTAINGATQVYSGTPSAWVIGWNTIDIADFPIAAGQNIQVLVACNFGGGGSGSSTGTSFYYSSAGSSNFAYWQQDDTPPTSTPTINANRPNITFGGLIPPTCFPTSNLTVTAITLTSATLNWTLPPSGTPASYQWEVRSSGLPGSGGAQASGIVAAPALTANVAGLTATTAYTAYIRTDCGAGGFSTWTAGTAFNTLPANDLPTGAVPLAIDGVCSSTYSNAGAGLSTDEPKLSCKGSQTTAAQVWFSFVAPPGGFVKVSTDYASTALDTKIGLFSATNPNDLATYNIIACDDDGGVNGNSSALYASGLTPGTTYYVAVAHYNTSTTGVFCVDVKNVTSAMLAPTASCATVQGIAGFLSTYTGWISLIDNAGLLVANIRQNTGTATDFAGAYTAVAGPSRADVTGHTYLNRNYLITGTNATSANLRLYFSDAEVSGLGSPLGTLNISRVPGSTCNPDFSGTAATITPVSSSSVNGISWIELVTPGFSNFYIMAGTTPLPVKLEKFTGRMTGNSNQLDWKTAEEKNFSHFELQRSADGILFDKIAVIPALGKTTGSTYSYTDGQPFEGKNLYRLNMVDRDGKSSLSGIVELSVKSGNGLSVNVHPNPVKQQLHLVISGKPDGNSHILLTDIMGKTIAYIILNGNTAEIDMSSLPSGLYIIKYSDNSHTSITKVTKD